MISFNVTTDNLKHSMYFTNINFKTKASFLCVRQRAILFVAMRSERSSVIWFYVIELLRDAKIAKTITLERIILAVML